MNDAPKTLAVLKQRSTYKNLPRGGWVSLVASVIAALILVASVNHGVGQWRALGGLQDAVVSAELGSDGDAVFLQGELTQGDIVLNDMGYEFYASAVLRVQREWGEEAYECGDSDDPETCYRWAWIYQDEDSWHADYVAINGLEVDHEFLETGLFKTLPLTELPPRLSPADYGYNAAFEPLLDGHSIFLQREGVRPDEPEEGDGRFDFYWIVDERVSLIGTRMSTGVFPIAELDAALIESGDVSINALIGNQRSSVGWSVVLAVVVVFILLFIAQAAFWSMGIMQRALQGAEILLVLKSAALWLAVSTVLGLLLGLF